MPQAASHREELAGTHAPSREGNYGQERRDICSIGAGRSAFRWCRPVRRRASAVGLSAAALVFAAACSSDGTSADGSSAGTPLAPRQAVLAAATQAQQVTSATETLTVGTDR
jgi:hypothetical protein